MMLLSKEMSKKKGVEEKKSVNGEGASRRYRDMSRHGVIRLNKDRNFSLKTEMQTKRIEEQYQK